MKAFEFLVILTGFKGSYYYSPPSVGQVRFYVMTVFRMFNIITFGCLDLENTDPFLTRSGSNIQNIGSN